MSRRFTSGVARQRLKSVPLLACGTLLVLLALGNLAWSFVAIADRRELMYGEAIIYDQAARILHGEWLYQPLDRAPYTVAAYTPLYYDLAAGVRAIAGPGFGPGRSLSFLAGLIATALVGRLAAEANHGRLTGVAAAVVFLGLAFPGIDPWSALYKEDTLGLALSLGSVALVSGRPTTRRSAAAGLMAGLAILTKQTFVAASAAPALWLWRRDRRSALIFALVDAAVVLATALVLESTTHAFLTNTLAANLNPFRLDVVPYNLALFASMQTLPLVLTALYLRWARPWRRTDGQLRIMYWLAAALPLIGLAKVGSSHNYWTEFAAATAVFAARGAQALVVRTHIKLSRRAIVACAALLSAYLALAVPIAGVLALPRPTSVRPKPYNSEAFMEVVDRVRSESGDVLADPLDVVALADKPITLEPFIFSILYAERQWDPDPLVARICAGRVALLVLGYPLEEASGRGGFGYPVWPPPVLEALRTTMELDREQAGLFLYVWRSDRSASAHTYMRGGALSQSTPPLPNSARVCSS